MKFIYYIDKEDLQLYGYESNDIAREFHDNYDNLILLDEKTSNEYRFKRPDGGRWTAKGWVVDDDLLAQELEAEKKAEADAIQAERAKLMQEMQLKLLLGEQEEAKEIALKIKEINLKIDSYK